MTDLKALTKSCALAALVTLCAPLTPAFAQSDAPQQFQVPAGCTAYLTVQSRECTVTHYWTCAADPEGHFWNVSMDSDGPFHLSYSDEDYRWLQNYELRSGAESVLIEPEDDPANFSELLDTGTDAMVFSMQRTENGVTYERRYTGYDTLTGDEIVIDGERLLITAFSYRFETESGTLQVVGNQFVHPELRLFFGGLETVELDGETFETDRSPREIIRPGESGFLSTRPIYDCGEVMSHGIFGLARPAALQSQP